MKLGYLCVTGSVGWGYYIADSSDVDLRGVFYRTKKEELLDCKSDQIEKEIEPIESVFWSFDKFYSLLLNSNPTAIEWLLSPVLFEDVLFKNLRKQIRAKNFNKYRLAKHYISLSRGNYEKYTKKLTEKKRIYITRGLISCQRVLDDELPLMDTREMKIMTRKNITEGIKKYETMLKKVKFSEYDLIKEKYDDVLAKYYEGD
ncbi:nucleotidyltransferase domain-containing protein [Candidatus Micrarchaeota archaeon]|jgi:predicted nucleotidyltransferase|nr:nucleotidyltransferase domain-containing protein [Candidatus Micrarchaeota archaeon]